MTIRDLLENGIQIQGSFNIRVWNREKEETTEEIKGEDFEGSVYEIDDKILDEMEITFMYAEGGEIIIEVAEEED